MDFTKQMGETVLDVPLEDVIKTWKEGLLMKKVCFTAKIDKEEQTYKFGVFNTKGWLKTIEKTIEEKTNQKNSQ